MLFQLISYKAFRERPKIRAHQLIKITEVFSNRIIEKEDNQLEITYVTVPETPERELTWLQRLVTLGKSPKLPESIPAKTVVDL